MAIVEICSWGGFPKLGVPLWGPHNEGYPPTLGGVLDGFSNGEGENPLPFSLTVFPKKGWGGGGG